MMSAIAFLSCLLVSVATPVSLDSVFTDHMVLQRNRPIRFSGSAAADATIEVELDGVKGSAKADAMGRWMVELPARKEGGPYAVTVVRREGGEAKETLRLEDVLVGEVWLGSGQSNMEFWVLGENLESPKFYSLRHGETDDALYDFLQTQRNGRKGNTCDARYVWLPVIFKDGVPRVEWRDEWNLAL